MSDYNNTVSDFRAGQRVELHPALDSWMRGDRYGKVVKVGKTLVWVRLDKSDSLRFFSPLSIKGID